VCCLPGGRLLSGGMDGRLWLWPAAGAAGNELKAAHAAPVSKVAALPTAASAHNSTPTQPSPVAAGRAGLAHSSSGSSRARGSLTTGPAASRHASASQGPALAVSCSYDKTVKVWDVSGRAVRQLAVLSGHPGPVLELAVGPAGDVLLTGNATSGPHHKEDLGDSPRYKCPQGSLSQNCPQCVTLCGAVELQACTAHGMCSIFLQHGMCSSAVQLCMLMYFSVCSVALSIYLQVTARAA
jgi:hypothetical protein